MKIIVDAFGGDNAPQQIRVGLRPGQGEPGDRHCPGGDKARLEACARSWTSPSQLAKMEILPAASC